uniref:Uncharacterized protein n=1 Tax=Candidatus Kentrum sp. MB TaxID=2138164 RepID=A0A451BEW2_9GAMM|nr:MAG: hypothetical protein BECKMB1821I_GA0114274_101937 [Candidatus Kentron sp. MB]VFK30983.1 MAG: hypothetical protein BECKMB1821G_GA0114241_107412 [Candidatus Kentron sp. MB]VFK76813.1 MAG: hypothetical protein BECKMB1821H_GA0114242_107612 [Candidatus Kentron sp. MB]
MNPIRYRKNAKTLIQKERLAVSNPKMWAVILTVFIKLPEAAQLVRMQVTIEAVFGMMAHLPTVREPTPILVVKCARRMSQCFTT